jgi:hypothetical protein
MALNASVQYRSGHNLAREPFPGFHTLEDGVMSLEIRRSAASRLAPIGIIAATISISAGCAANPMSNCVAFVKSDYGVSRTTAKNLCEIQRAQTGNNRFNADFQEKTPAWAH